MRRDGDEILAVALLDPRRYRLDRMRERIGADRIEAGVLRQPLEVAARGEDQPRFAALLALQDLRAVSQQAPAHSPSITRGCQSPGGQRATKNKVSNRRTAWNFGTQRANGVSAAGVELEPGCPSARSAKSSSAVSCRWSSSACCRSGGGREADRDRSFLDRFADRGDGRAVLEPELCRELPVGLVDPPAGKDQRAGRERHAFGALDHQQLGRAAGRSRTRIRVAAGIASSVMQRT